jgi:toxin ParE1/3/4
MKVTWTAQARTRLAEIHDYIAQDSKPRALAMVERILDRAEVLMLAPRSGARLQAFVDDEVRELLERPYRIIYRVSATSNLSARTRFAILPLRRSKLKNAALVWGTFSAQSPMRDVREFGLTNIVDVTQDHAVGRANTAPGQKSVFASATPPDYTDPRFL